MPESNDTFLTPVLLCNGCGELLAAAPEGKIRLAQDDAMITHTDASGEFFAIAVKCSECGGVGQMHVRRQSPQALEQRSE